MKHFYLFTTLLFESSSQFAFKSFHRAALLINKYEDIMEINKLVKYIEMSNMQKDTLLFMSIITTIYHLPFAESLCKELQALKYHEDPTDFVADKLIYSEPFMLFGSNCIQRIYELSGVGVNTPIARCRWINNNPEISALKYQNDDVLDNISIGIAPNDVDALSAWYHFRWSEDNLIPTIHVCDSKLCLPEAGLRFATNAYEYDSVEVNLVIYQDEMYLRYSFLIAPQKDGSVQVRDYIHNHSILQLESKYIVTEDGYEVTLTIPWKCLNVLPYEGMCLIYNIAVNDCDDLSYGRLRRMTVAPSGKYSGFVRNYPRLYLE